MVYFQCETCCASLKKKQVENHYLYECRKSQIFTCLSCGQQFDRETMKAHTQCISEEEKYQKGDKMVKKAIIINKPKEIVKCDINKLKWSGFKKTSKIILMNFDNYKLKIEELINKLKSKHFTQSRITRMLLHILCSYTKDLANSFKEITYILDIQ